MLLSRTADLNFQYVFAEALELFGRRGAGSRANTHGFIRLLIDLEEVSPLTGACLAVELAQPFLVLTVGVGLWDDGNRNALIFVSVAGDLCNVARAKTDISRQAEARDSLEH